MRVATFNVNFRGGVAAQRLGALVDGHGVDLLLLQEANPSSLQPLVHTAGLDWVISAYDAGAPQPSSRGRVRVVAIAGRGQAPTKVGYLADVALPERIVFAEIDSPLGPLQVASYHAPPGVTWGRVKVDHAHALLDWINQATGPVVLGADANTPDIDHPDRDQVVTHWTTGLRRLRGQSGDDATFGGHPVHDLDDAFRRWLDDHPDQLAAIVRERPAGPLAISHVTGKHHDRPDTPRRFDTIWISRSLAVRSMTYDYPGAVEAGTDHALVTAELYLAQVAELRGTTRP